MMAVMLWVIGMLWQQARDWLREPLGGLVRQPEPGMFPVQIQLLDGTSVPAVQFPPGDRAFAERANREGRFVLVPPCYLVLPEYAPRMAARAKVEAPTFPMRQAKGVQ